ncbi:MAG: glycosyltransferase [Verrucomicrobiota bacterium]|nr:glycosyltransferase [Verrucomicrobiota bacterium]
MSSPVEPKKPLVLHLILSLKTGGLEKLVVSLANHSSQFSPLICCLEQTGPLHLNLNLGVKVIEIDRRPGLRIADFWRLIRIVKAHGVNLIHTHNAAAGLYGGIAGFLTGVPVVHTKHGMNFTGGNEKYLNKLVYALSRKVVAVSTAAREVVLSEGCAPDKVSIIDNGVDLTSYYSTPERRLEARELLKLGESDLCIGTLGRLSPEKNQALLVQAFAAAQIKNGKLVLLGDGPDFKKIQGTAAALGLSDRIMMPGNVTHPEIYLPAFDIFVMPSKSEGLPIALLEAMASGAVPIVSSTGAMPYVVMDGRCGLVFPVDNQSTLTTALMDLAKNPPLRTSLSRQAQSRVEEHFNIVSTVKSYESLYRTLLME